MMKKAVQVYMISVLKPCQNLINRGSMSQLIRMAPPTPPSPTTHFLVGPPKVDPCVRLFFQDLGSLKDVLQLLPSAWSHNPLTMLKIICNLEEAQSDEEAFLTAMVWLHQNHPNTLAHNLLPITVYFSCIINLIPLLTRVLLDGRCHEVDHEEAAKRKIIASSLGGGGGDISQENGSQAKSQRKTQVAQRAVVLDEGRRHGVFSATT
ncbi:hypothetical protein FF1_030171 [Malus domestica]